MRRTMRPDEPVEGEEVFNDVVLDDGRVAVARLGLDALYIDTYRVRRWVMAVGSIALAAHLLFVLRVTTTTQLPFFPWYVILMFSSIWMHEKVRQRFGFGELNAIDVQDRRVVFHLSGENSGRVTIIPKSWQRERFLARLHECAPAALAAEAPHVPEPSFDVHALANADRGWLPEGRTPLAMLGGLAALVVGIFLGAMTHLDPSFPAIGGDLAWGAAALGIVIWGQDAGNRLWFARQLERVTGTTEAPLTVDVKTGSAIYGWRSVEVEPTHLGFAFVSRHSDFFELLSILGLGCIASTALLGEVSFLGAAVATLLLRVSGYPRQRVEVDEFLTSDVAEYADDYGRGTLTIASDEIRLRYQSRVRDRLMAFFAEHAPDAVVHAPVRIRNVGESRRSQQTTDLDAIHDRVRELDGSPASHE